MSWRLAGVCKRRPEFILGGLHDQCYADLMFDEHGRLKQGALENLIVRPPARWDFTHTYVFGTISDACCCANRYGACAQFLGVEPLHKNDPIHPINIMLQHKETSPWYH